MFVLYKSKITQFFNTGIRRMVFMCLMWCFCAGFVNASGGDVKHAVLSEMLDMLDADTLITDKQDIRLQIIEAKEHDEIPDSAFVRLITIVGKSYQLVGRSSLPIRYYVSAANYYHAIDDPTEEQLLSMVRIYIPLGAAHEESNMPAKALEYYNMALPIAEKHGFETEMARIYNNIGVIHFRNNDFDKAEEWFNKAIDVNTRNENADGLMLNYNNLSGACLGSGDKNRAIDYALRSITLAERLDDRHTLASMKINMASLHLDLGEPELAISYLKSIDEMVTAPDMVWERCHHLSLMSTYYRKINNTKLAYQYMQMALDLAQQNDISFVRLFLLREYAGMQYDDRHYEQAAATLMDVVRINDSLTSISDTQKALEMRDIYEADNMITKQELELRDISLRKARAERLWMALALLLVCLTALFIGYYRHARSKACRQAEENMLTKRQNELLEQEHLLQMQKEQHIQELLDQRNRELTRHTMGRIEMNGFLSELEDDVKQLLKALPQRVTLERQLANQILNKIEHNGQKDSWEQFHCYFEQVHPSFYANLNARYPDLTVKEQHLCAFIKLGLSSKEIAAILFVEVRSVESSRLRLRKKLDISQDTNLTAFFSQF